MQVITREAADEGLRRFVELPDDVEQMIDPEVVCHHQRLVPAVNLVDGTERVVEWQFGDDALEFLGITQRMIRTRREEVQDHDAPAFPDLREE